MFLLAYIFEKATLKMCQCCGCCCFSVKVLHYTFLSSTTVNHLYPRCYLCYIVTSFVCYYRARLDLKTIPLNIELRELLRVQICICVWKCWCFDKTLIKKLIWKFESSSIIKNLINYKDPEHDTPVPDLATTQKQYHG